MRRELPPTLPCQYADAYRVSIDSIYQRHSLGASPLKTQPPLSSLTARGAPIAGWQPHASPLQRFSERMRQQAPVFNSVCCIAICRPGTWNKDSVVEVLTEAFHAIAELSRIIGSWVSHLEGLISSAPSIQTLLQVSSDLLAMWMYPLMAAWPWLLALVPGTALCAK